MGTTTRADVKPRVRIIIAKVFGPLSGLLVENAESGNFFYQAYNIAELLNRTAGPNSPRRQLHESRESMFEELLIAANVPLRLDDLDPSLRADAVRCRRFLFSDLHLSALDFKLWSLLDYHLFLSAGVLEGGEFGYGGGLIETCPKKCTKHDV